MVIYTGGRVRYIVQLALHCTERLKCSAVHCTALTELHFIYLTALHCTRPSVVQCRSETASALHCSAVQCSAVPCSVVQCSAVQCSSVQCSAVQCSAVQCSAVQCSAVQCSAVHRTLPRDGGHRKAVMDTNLKKATILLSGL
jgi:hypothetical protein